MSSVPEPPETSRRHIVAFRELAYEARSESINIHTSQTFVRSYHNFLAEGGSEGTPLFAIVCQRPLNLKLDRLESQRSHPTHITLRHPQAVVNVGAVLDVLPPEPPAQAVQGI